MRGIKLEFNLTELAVQKGHRYVVRMGDGIRSEVYTLANPTDQYNTPQWSMLVGESRKTVVWSTDRQEMYVDIWRQYPNPAFDFSPEGYQHYEWLLAQMDVTTFRLNNPLFMRACLDWPHGNSWTGGSVPFSEGDSHTYSYDINEYQFKYNESGVKWAIKRHDDSDNFKEFAVTLTV